MGMGIFDNYSEGLEDKSKEPYERLLFQHYNPEAKKKKEDDKPSLISSGAYWLRSTIDPRWNFEGHGCVGGLVMPEECRKKIDECKQKFGEPPKDLSWGYTKD